VYYTSRIKLFDKIQDLLIESGKLNVTNRNLLAGKYLALARQLKEIGEVKLASDVWGNAKVKQLISNATFEVGKLYLGVSVNKIFKSSLPGKLLKAFFYPLFPKHLI
jgi:hypothetical protein